MRHVKRLLWKVWSSQFQFSTASFIKNLNGKETQLSDRLDFENKKTKLTQLIVDWPIELYPTVGASN